MPKKGDHRAGKPSIVFRCPACVTGGQLRKPRTPRSTSLLAVSSPTSQASSDRPRDATTLGCTNRSGSIPRPNRHSSQAASAPASHTLGTYGVASSIDPTRREVLALRCRCSRRQRRDMGDPTGVSLVHRPDVMARRAPEVVHERVFTEVWKILRFPAAHRTETHSHNPRSAKIVPGPW